MESKMPEEWKWAKGGKSFLRALDPHLTSNKSLTFNLQKKKNLEMYAHSMMGLFEGRHLTRSFKAKCCYRIPSTQL